MTLNNYDSEHLTYLIYLHILSKHKELSYIDQHKLRRAVINSYDIEDLTYFKLQSIYAICRLRKYQLVNVHTEKINEEDDMSWFDTYKINEKGINELSSFLMNASEHERQIITFIP